MCKKKMVDNYLRKYRVEMGFSQKDISEIMGHKNQSTISAWEKGTHLPSLENAFRLAALYRRPVIFLYHYFFLKIREEIRIKEEEWKLKFSTSEK